MNPKEYRNQILTMGLLAVMPRVARGGDAINPLEAQKIIEGIAQTKDGAADAQQQGILELLGVDRELWRRLNEEVGSGSCAQLLAAKARQAGQGSATRLAMNLVLSADNMVQEIAKTQFMDGKAVSSREITAAQAAQAQYAPRKAVVTPDLAFSKGGWFFPTISADFDSVEAYSLFEMQMKELALHGAVANPKASVLVNKLTTGRNFQGENVLTIDFTIDLLHGNSVRLRVKNWRIDETDTKEEVAAMILVAGVQHAELLRDPQRMHQEINMLRYDLLKLYRVASDANKPDIKLALAELTQTTSTDFFESSTTYLGRLLKAELLAKCTIVELAQAVQEELAVAQESGTETSTAGRKKGKRSKRRAVASPVASSDVKVGFQRRNSVAQPLYRQRDDGFYYPATYYDSDTMHTMLWMMDPQFMISHPWYWGVRDNSVMAHWMLFEAMSQRHHEAGQAATPFFLNHEPYKPELFTQPVEPQLSNSEAQPFKDAWDMSPVADAQKIEAAEMLGWTAITGPSAGEDFMASPGADTSASSSGWTSIFGSGGGSSGESDSASTPSSTTGLFDFTTTGSSSTTGVFDFTTTGSTTTGSDWSSTTTTGSDWSSTTTGSYDSTGSTGSGSDW